LNLENKLDEKQQRLETVQESLTTLRIKYETETASKDNELKLREKAIRLLKSQAEQSREELLRERLDLKEEKMEEVADELGIDLGQINKLRNYYENLINARESLNQSDISTSEYNIARIKQEILNKGISIKKVQKLCSKCEKAAKLRIELGINSNSIPQIQPQTNTNYSFSRERN
jgi:NACalpha-BTF3-like transcription factor